MDLLFVAMKCIILQIAIFGSISSNGLVESIFSGKPPDKCNSDLPIG